MGCPAWCLCCHHSLMPYSLECEGSREPESEEAKSRHELKVEVVEAGNFCDRTLSPTKDLCSSKVGNKFRALGEFWRSSFSRKYPQHPKVEDDDLHDTTRSPLLYQLTS